jgi:hypothetical protein
MAQTDAGLVATGKASLCPQVWAGNSPFDMLGALTPGTQSRSRSRGVVISPMWRHGVVKQASSQSLTPVVPDTDKTAHMAAATRQALLPTATTAVAAFAKDVAVLVDGTH